jgi:RNA polymerase sigma-70 factor (ECF subfamily)
MRMLDDAALMQHVAERRHADAAIAELHRRHARPLCAAVRHRFGDGAAAEDAVQETFVRAWRHADRFDPASGSVGGWLRTIAMRAAVDLFRCTARSVVTVGPAPQDRPEPQRAGRVAVNVGATEAEVVLEVVLNDALAALSVEHREVLQHAYRADLSQSQIATRLGLPLGTVKTRTFWALAMLRRTLAPTFDRRIAA